MKLKNIFLNGIFKENPILIMLVGLCPALAVTTGVQNAIGMGAATTFVLLGSNIIISLIKRFIPDSVRLPCFIIVIAGFATIIGFLMEFYLPEINNSLGIFLSLIVVNCIIFARAEIFASKNGVISSFVDGLGFGIGFTLAIFIIASIREILGSGTWHGIPILKNICEPMTFFITPAGGFFVIGCVIAVMNVITKNKSKKQGCEGCSLKEKCAK